MALDSGSGLANATLQQRLVPVRLFYDFLVEEGLRQSNPVGRGRYAVGRPVGGSAWPLVPRMVKLPWIPTDQQWLDVLAVFRVEPIRNRLMLALAYDAALRREELCALRTDDLDPAHRMLRIRAETTKTRRERAVPYSMPTGELLSGYLAHRSSPQPCPRAIVLVRITAQPSRAPDAMDVVQGGAARRPGGRCAPVLHPHPPGISV